MLDDRGARSSSSSVGERPDWRLSTCRAIDKTLGHLKSSRHVRNDSRRGTQAGPAAAPQQDDLAALLTRSRAQIVLLTRAADLAKEDDEPAAANAAAPVGSSYPVMA